MSSYPLLKNALGNQEIDRLALSMKEVNASLPYEKFTRKAKNGVGALALKARVQFLINCLAECLPDSFERTAPILSEMVLSWRTWQEKAPVNSFGAWPLIDYVSEYGLGSLETSLSLLKEFTSLFSSEFAIRPFIERYPDTLYGCLLEWSEDPNPHVRRLSSEGIRPRLPWGQQLKTLIEDPSPILPILSSLMEDPSLYVRKSVANNLNDISKDHPELAIRFAKTELKNKQKKTIDPKNTGRNDDVRYWIINKGLRSLIKKGHPKVFPLLGYTAEPQLTIEASLDRNQLSLGEALMLNLQLKSLSKRSQTIVVDYAIEFVKSNQRHSAKVFKWKNLRLAPGTVVEIEKKHLFKPLTTRKYYAGDHQVNILVNGQPHLTLEFHLDVS